MARKPKNYAQLTNDVEALEAKLKSLKELQAQARKKEQSKLAEKVGKIVMKAYPNVDFLSLSDAEIAAMFVTNTSTTSNQPIQTSQSTVSTVTSTVTEV